VRADLRDVTAVVVTHEARGRLEAVLAALRAQGEFAEILVVDSGSRDGTGEGQDGVRLVAYPENVGPCVTRNRGLREALTPLVLLLDDDTVLEPGAVAALRQALLEEPRAAAAGPVVLGPTETDRVQYAGGDPHFVGLFHVHRGPCAGAQGPPRPVGVLTSGCLLVRPELALAGGGFLEPLFYLMEDLEWSLQMRARGHELLLVPAARVRNAGASAGLSIRGAVYPRRRAQLQARNRWLVLVATLAPWSLAVLAGPLLLFELVHAAFGVRGGLFGAVLRGKVEAMGLLSRARERRRSLSLERRRSDAELFGSPPLSLSSAAGAVAGAGRAARFLDGFLRLIWTPARALLG
jgi:N-acetylglucosaminyl-diphospho-decaprenol L-rhamnosyltransferase